MDGLQVYRVTEAARRLAISRSKAYEMIKSGALGSVRIGGSIRVPRQALEELIESGLDSRTDRADQ